MAKIVLKEKKKWGNFELSSLRWTESKGKAIKVVTETRPKASLKLESQ